MPLAGVFIALVAINNIANRHSREGGNPEPRFAVSTVDSRLRGNDEGLRI
jgi:hypothetical protein